VTSDVRGCMNVQLIDLPRPYGNCEPSDDYVQSECLAECEAKFVIKNCSCKDVYMPGILALNVVQLLRGSTLPHVVCV